MKKTLLLALALVAVGCSESIPRNLDELLQQGDIYLDPQNLKPYTGPIFKVATADSSKLIGRFTLREGQFDGSFEEYSADDGHLLYTGTYKDGVARYERYDEDGQLVVSGTKKNGEWDGTQETYNENGQLILKRTFRYGLLQGPYERYSENGRLREKRTYKDGELVEAADRLFNSGSAVTGVPPDLSTMTPVEAADRLFNRVVTAFAAGDSTEAQQFMPMAIGAYERAEPLNNDGLFHLSMLQRSAMQLEAALGTAEEILEDNPNHLLGLSAAAKAAVALGLGDIAAAYYEHVLEVYESQIEQDLPEYVDHAPITNNLRSEAEAFLKRL